MKSLSLKRGIAPATESEADGWKDLTGWEAPRPLFRPIGGNRQLFCAASVRVVLYCTTKVTTTVAQPPSAVVAAIITTNT
jgi:hypothetical protein